ncbi:hypothetical protein L9F63_015843 [Diploptera punctata]|uniref:Uncharacterized protein n=1 Tax=Diploptera punctata TaxID=6984 RepID=A0AAD8A621_DIPPU|nr:hypothetical protein L9F63_015843 [Diploptera punctata]
MCCCQEQHVNTTVVIMSLLSELEELQRCLENTTDSDADHKSAGDASNDLDTLLQSEYMSLAATTTTTSVSDLEKTLTGDVSQDEADQDTLPQRDSKFPDTSAQIKTASDISSASCKAAETAGSIVDSESTNEPAVLHQLDKNVDTKAESRKGNLESDISNLKSTEDTKNCETLGENVKHKENTSKLDDVPKPTINLKSTEDTSSSVKNPKSIEDKTNSSVVNPESSEDRTKTSVLIPKCIEDKTNSMVKPKSAEDKIKSMLNPISTEDKTNPSVMELESIEDKINYSVIKNKTYTEVKSNINPKYTEDKAINSSVMNKKSPEGKATNSYVINPKSSEDKATNSSVINPKSSEDKATNSSVMKIKSSEDKLTNSSLIKPESAEYKTNSSVMIPKSSEDKSNSSVIIPRSSEDKATNSSVTNLKSSGDKATNSSVMKPVSAEEKNSSMINPESTENAKTSQIENSESNKDMTASESFVTDVLRKSYEEESADIEMSEPVERRKRVEQDSPSGRISDSKNISEPETSPASKPPSVKKRKLYTEPPFGCDLLEVPMGGTSPETLLRLQNSSQLLRLHKPRTLTKKRKLVESPESSPEIRKKKIVCGNVESPTQVEVAPLGAKEPLIQEEAERLGKELLEARVILKRINIPTPEPLVKAEVENTLQQASNNVVCSVSSAPSTSKKPKAKPKSSGPLKINTSKVLADPQKINNSKILQKNSMLKPKTREMLTKINMPTRLGSKRKRIFTKKVLANKLDTHSIVLKKNSNTNLKKQNSESVIKSRPSNDIKKKVVKKENTQKIVSSKKINVSLGKKKMNVKSNSASVEKKPVMKKVVHKSVSRKAVVKKEAKLNLGKKIVVKSVIVDKTTRNASKKAGTAMTTRKVVNSAVKPVVQQKNVADIKPRPASRAKDEVQLVSRPKNDAHPMSRAKHEAQLMSRPKDEAQPVSRAKQGSQLASRPKGGTQSASRAKGENQSTSRTKDETQPMCGMKDEENGGEDEWFVEYLLDEDINLPEVMKDNVRVSSSDDKRPSSRQTVTECDSSTDKKVYALDVSTRHKIEVMKKAIGDLERIADRSMLRLKAEERQVIYLSNKLRYYETDKHFKMLHKILKDAAPGDNQNPDAVFIVDLLLSYCSNDDSENSNDARSEKPNVSGNKLCAAIETRTKEHFRNIKNCEIEKSAIAAHSLPEHHKIEKEAKLLKQLDKPLELTIWEMIFIQKNKYRSMNFDILVDKNLITKFIIPTKDGSTRGDVTKEINNHGISSMDDMTDEEHDIV